MDVLPHILFPFYCSLLCVPDSSLKSRKAVVMNFIWQYTEPKPNSSILLRPPTMGSLTGLEVRHIITQLSWNKEHIWRMFFTCGQGHICRLMQNENSMRTFLRWLLHKKEIRNKIISHFFTWPTLICKINREKMFSLHLCKFTILVRNK